MNIPEKFERAEYIKVRHTDLKGFIADVGFDDYPLEEALDFPPNGVLMEVSAKPLHDLHPEDVQIYQEWADNESDEAPDLETLLSVLADQGFLPHGNYLIDVRW